MRKSNQKGFTLIEVVISIGVLALLSGFILQFFITSDKLNRRSGDVDQANVLAVSLMETFKAQDTPELTRDTDPFLVLASIAKTERGVSVVALYNKNWQPVEANAPDAAFALYAEIGLEQAGGTLMLNTNGTGGIQRSGLYRMQVQVRSLTLVKQNAAEGSRLLADPLLIDNTVRRYFVWEEAGQ